MDVATGSRDIYSAIDGAFDVQRVHVEGSEAEQYGAISRLPPVLQVQVQRVQFDQVKKTSFKSTHHLKLRETIYLDRYMDAAPGTERAADLDQRRRQKWKWKEELRMLEARRAELVGSEVGVFVGVYFQADGIRTGTLFPICLGIPRNGLRICSR